MCLEIKCGNCSLYIGRDIRGKTHGCRKTHTSKTIKDFWTKSEKKLHWTATQTRTEMRGRSAGCCVGGKVTTE